MTSGARSAEELDTLLEDAFVLRNAQDSARLFEVTGVLVVDGHPAVRGRARIGRAFARLWSDGCGYLADTHRVVSARDVALILGSDVVHLARRGQDGSWRYAITVLR